MIQKDIFQINSNSNIAICTLWSKKENLLELLYPEVLEKVNMIGTLYTSYGINCLLQTLGEHPEINKIIVYGADLSNSGKDLINLFESNTNKIKLLFDRKRTKPILDTVKVVDLRNEYKKENVKILNNTIKKNYSPGKFREKVGLKIKEAEISSFPIPISGTCIYDGSSIFRSWVKLLNQIFYFGFEKPSEYGESQLELLNLIVTIGLYGKEYKLEKEFFEYIKKEEFEEHVREILSPETPKDVEYTYGSRAFNHPIAGNQIEKVINYFTKTPYTSRAVAVLWDHTKDFGNKFPPCIDLYQGIISGDYYNHTAYIRSNDMEKGWPVNMYGQIKLAEYIVSRINEIAGTDYKVGTITTISCSAHLYEHSWKTGKEILEKYGSKLSEFIPDPRGNFVIYHSEDKDKVRVEHRTFNHKLIRTYVEDSFDKIYNSLKSIFLLSEHALYLGKEIKTAFESLKRGKKYQQDKA